jgi:hypothetical protein
MGTLEKGIRMKPLLPVILTRILFAVWIVLFWVEVAAQIAIWRGWYRP